MQGGVEQGAGRQAQGSGQGIGSREGRHPGWAAVIAHCRDGHCAEALGCQGQGSILAEQGQGVVVDKGPPIGQQPDQVRRARGLTGHLQQPLLCYGLELGWGKEGVQGGHCAPVHCRHTKGVQGSSVLLQVNVLGTHIAPH